MFRLHCITPFISIHRLGFDPQMSWHSYSKRLDATNRERVVQRLDDIPHAEHDTLTMKRRPWNNICRRIEHQSGQFHESHC